MKSFERPVSPDECVVVFGIPTSKTGFVRHLGQRSRHDFVPNVCPAWPAYERLVEQIELAIPRINSFGVDLRQDATLSQFAEVFFNKRVVILFTHWANDRVEFDDGLHRIDTVAAAVPETYDGVIDLCVCHPDELVMTLRRDRPACLIKRTRSKARVSFWLQFYQVLFRVLTDRHVTYSEAVAITATSLMGTEIDTVGGLHEIR